MNKTFLYIILISHSLSKLIKTSYTITDGKMWTSIALGVPTINLHKPISLNSHYSIITDRSYNKTKSKTSSHKTYKMIYYGSKEINAEVICEVAPSAANNFSVLKYCFYYIIDSDLIFNSIEKFGFAFSPYDKELSLIHQLKKNNPDKEFYFPENMICPNMKKTTLQDVYDALTGKKEEIILDEETSKKALTALENMHKLGK